MNRGWNGFLAFLALSASLWVASSLGQAPEGPPSGLRVRRHRANHLIGAKVENLDGEKVGRVDNFIFDRHSGKVEFVLISSGGVLGIGSTIKPVPAAAINMYTSKAGVLAMDINKIQWRAAPSFRNNSLAALGGNQEIKTLHDYYSSAANKSGMVVRRPGGASATLLPTGHPTIIESPKGPLTLILGSEIIGKSVLDRQNNVLGQINDLIVELPPRQPAFAVITAGRALRKKHTYAVSLEVLNKAKADKLVLGIDPRAFDQAKSFDRSSNPDQKDDDVYLYSERKAPGGLDNNLGNKHLTPLQQSESPGDLDLTQRIRQQLIHDDSLSFTAKNVKIISINGKVVLKGAVNTAKEKEIIQTQAEKIAGSQNVDNQLAVFQKR